MFNTNWHMQASWLGRLSSSWIIPTGLAIKASVSDGVGLLPLIITFVFCNIIPKRNTEKQLLIFHFFLILAPAVGSNPAEP